MSNVSVTRRTGGRANKKTYASTVHAVAEVDGTYAFTACGRGFDTVLATALVTVHLTDSPVTCGTCRRAH